MGCGAVHAAGGHEHDERSLVMRDFELYFSTYDACFSFLKQPFSADFI